MAKYLRPQTRLPLEPLFALSHRVGRRDIARWLEVPERRISDWQEQGGIPLWSADRIAIRLGSHPALIWGDAFYGEQYIDA